MSTATGQRCAAIAIADTPKAIGTSATNVYVAGALGVVLVGTP
jgi:hypothetical protein